MAKPIPHPTFPKLHLLKQKTSKNWFCGTHKNGKHLRKSTRTSIKQDAFDFAEQWYIEQLSNIASETPSNVKTIKDMSIIAINELRVFVERGERSSEYIKGVLGYMGKHILPFFGDMPVTEVTRLKWKQFIKLKYKENPTISRNTLHQMRNALSMCLNAALDEEIIDTLPVLKIKSLSKKNEKPRIWFKPDEQKILLETLDHHIDYQVQEPHLTRAKYLKEYVLFRLHTGLRTGEILNLKYKNIEFREYKDIAYLLINNVQGKRGIGTVKCDLELSRVYMEMMERRGHTDINSLIFPKTPREMFNVVLDKCNLKTDGNGNTRDTTSLRHTYICNKLIAGVPVQDIAKNCRNSVDVIERHYAKWLAPELLTSFHDMKIKADEIELEAFYKNSIQPQQDIIDKAQQEIKAIEEKILAVAKPHGIDNINDVISEMEKRGLPQP